jgi:hypothetical protein
MDFFILILCKLGPTLYCLFHGKVYTVCDHAYSFILDRQNSKTIKYI